MSALLSALMPLHAARADAALPTAKPETASFCTPPMQFSKYLIFTRYPGTSEVITIFSAEIQHSDMLPMGAVAISAGFLAIACGQIIVPQIGSTTLNKIPRPCDAARLREFLNLAA